MLEASTRHAAQGREGREGLGPISAGVTPQQRLNPRQPPGERRPGPPRPPSRGPRNPRGFQRALQNLFNLDGAASGSWTLGGPQGHADLGRLVRRRGGLEGFGASSTPCRILPFRWCRQRQLNPQHAPGARRPGPLRPLSVARGCNHSLCGTYMLRCMGSLSSVGGPSDSAGLARPTGCRKVDDPTADPALFLHLTKTDTVRMGCVLAIPADPTDRPLERNPRELPAWPATRTARRTAALSWTSTPKQLS
jgi:hypothetical protein